MHFKSFPANLRTRTRTGHVKVKGDVAKVKLLSNKGVLIRNS